MAYVEGVDYTILDITFSKRQEVECDYDLDDTSHPSNFSNSKRTTYLDAHVTFDYHGEAGTCVCELQTLTVETFDDTEMTCVSSVTCTPLDFADMSEVKTACDEKINAVIDSMNFERTAKNFADTALAEISLYKL